MMPISQEQPRFFIFIILSTLIIKPIHIQYLHTKGIAPYTSNIRTAESLRNAVPCVTCVVCKQFMNGICAYNMTVYIFS